MADGWELLARWPGGTVSALAVVPGASGVVLATTAAGLHVLEDGGAAWRWVALGPDPVVEALAVSAGFEAGTSAGAILLGTTRGLYRSTDGGRIWRHVLAESRVQCIGATPDFADGAGGGVILAGTEADGLLRSEDGGLDWLGASAGLLDLNVTAVALSPAVASDRTAFAGTASGLYRSRNGGRAWRLVELGPEAPAIQAIAISPGFADDGLVLAGTEADGLFRSDDGGQSWEPVAGFPEPCVTSLTFAPEPGAPEAGGASARTIAAGTAAGVAVSHDGGQSWSLEAADLGPILATAATLDGAILAGTVGAGAQRRASSERGSAAWTDANHGLAGRATLDLAATTAYGPVPLIAVASLDAGVMLSHDGGATWKSGHAGLESVAATSAVFAETPDGRPRLLATFDGQVCWSDDIESGWQHTDLGEGPDGPVSSLDAVGTTGRPTSLLLASGRACLALSSHAGAAWEPLPLPTALADVVRAAASPTVGRDRPVYAVTRANRVASDGSLEPNGLELWQTSDLGRTWTRWLHAPTATVMALAVPPPGSLDTSLLVGYAGRVARPLRNAQEVRHGERRPLWQEANIGKMDSAVTALVLSPRPHRDRLVLAAADDKVYLSWDGGATFVDWNDDLDVPLVTALALVETGDSGLLAYALGLGGTLWQRRVRPA